MITNLNLINQIKTKYTPLINPLAISIFIISLSILCTTTLINNAEANMFNKFRKGFYFEKYKTAEEAKIALLKLHPIGSNSDNLTKTLEKAGAKLVNTVNRKDVSNNLAKEREYFYEEVSKLAIEKKHYEYHTGIPAVNPLLWKVMIFYDKNKMITNLYLGKHYMGL